MMIPLSPNFNNVLSMRSSVFNVLRPYKVEVIFSLGKILAGTYMPGKV